MAMTFDTRRAVQRLMEAGVDDREADAIVETMGDATSPLVTHEILRAEFAAFRAEMRAEMYALQLRLAAFAIGLAAVAVAIVKLT